MLTVQAVGEAMRSSIASARAGTRRSGRLDKVFSDSHGPRLILSPEAASHSGTPIARRTALPRSRPELQAEPLLIASPRPQSAATSRRPERGAPVGVRTIKLRWWGSRWSGQPLRLMPGKVIRAARR